MLTLDRLESGQSAVIKAVNGNGANRQHLLDMGLIPGVLITMIKTAPMGDPVEYKLHGYDLTLRKEDGMTVDVELSDDDKEEKQVKHKRSHAHPGLGESGYK